MVPRALVVEGDPVIGSPLESTLRVGVSKTGWVSTTERALGDRPSDPDLILLDVGLPDGDGFTVCRELWLRYEIATIVILTAQRDPLDVVAGLESGPTTTCSSRSAWSS
jgi:two-component system catabolic regulation response regulator CreB